MRLSIRGGVAAATLALSCTTAAFASPLHGKMAILAYLAGGTWNCTTRIPGAKGRPAQTLRTQATFGVAPGNVLHGSFSIGPYMGDQYYGYDAKGAKWWAIGADNQGEYVFQTSLDGNTYAGTVGGIRASADIKNVYHRITVNEVRIHEVDGSGARATAEDTVCTR